MEAKKQKEVITETQILNEMLVPLRDFFEGKVEVVGGALRLSFPNGQTFAVAVKEKIACYA